MDKRTLGQTHLYLSEIGIGCGGFWGKPQFDETQAIEIVHKAIELGVNFFDTGHNYSGGNAEIRLGKAIKDLPEKDQLIISTKCGTRTTLSGKSYKDFSPQWIIESCRLSRERLGLAQIPLFQLHSPSLHHLTDDVLETLKTLKREGYVIAVGVSNPPHDVFEKIIELDCFDFVMTNYSLLSQEREPIIQRLHDKGIGIIAAAPLGNSLYSNRIFKIKSLKDLWYLARALKNFRSRLIKGFSYRFINNVEGLTGAQVALQYVLSNENVTSAVFGTTSLEHLIENLAAVDKTIPLELMNRIKSVG